MKKLLSILLTLAMVFSLAVTTAFAVNLDTDGKITITTRNAGTVYNIYRILDVSSSTDDYSLLTYSVADGWEGFFVADDENPDALEYVEIDTLGAVKAKTTFTQTTAPEFAKLAMDYVKSLPEAERQALIVATATADGTNDVVFENLKMGYYLVDTSVGSLCALNTTQPNASINVKNYVPTIDKQVEEDSIGTDTNAWGPSNTADVGQTVNFDITINAQAGAENYVYYDVMDPGLTLDEDSIVVKFHKSGESGSYNLTPVTHYNITNVTPQTFNVEFTETLLKNVGAEDKIYILYSAVVNGDAVLDTDGVENKGDLSFGDNHWTETSSTKTYTYGFEIIKTDAAAVMLDGAKFELYANQADSTPISLYKEGVNSYRRPTAAELTAGTNIVTEIEVKLVDGKAIAKVDGFDNDVYYLKETASPTGYNAMSGFRTITISNGDVFATYENGAYKPGSGVQVINQKGAVLPTTGGMGTTMFITFGAITVMGAGVLLVTKKRMSMIED